jgi:phosphohistidine swiveling domain-containing protein
VIQTTRYEPTTAVDTRPHPLFTRYSDGNFAEVAPPRISPLAWSVIGPPVERGLRSLYGALAPQLSSVLAGPNYTFVGYFGFKPYHNADALFSIVPFVPAFEVTDIARHYLQGMDTSYVRQERVALRVQSATAVRAARRLLDMRRVYNEAEASVAAAEEAVSSGTLLDTALARVISSAVDLAWRAHVESTSFSALAMAWSERSGRRGLGDAWDAFGESFVRADEVVWESLLPLEGVAATAFLEAPYYEVGDQDPRWSNLTCALMPDGSYRSLDLGDEPRDELDDALCEVLARQVPPGLRALFRAAAHQTKLLLAERERSKALAMRALHTVRRALLQSDVTAVAGWSGCTFDELVAAKIDAGPTRLAELERALATELGPVLDFSENRVVAPTHTVPIAVAGGAAAGPVYSPGDHDPEPGGILVCERADSPLLRELALAAGVVCEKGSFLSHVAIICRALGIPAVVNVAGARQRFAPGQVIRVDGTAGTVEALR